MTTAYFSPASYAAATALRWLTALPMLASLPLRRWIGSDVSGSATVLETGIFPRLANVQITFAFFGSSASKASTRTILTARWKWRSNRAARRLCAVFSAM